MLRLCRSGLVWRYIVQESAAKQGGESTEIRAQGAGFELELGSCSSSDMVPGELRLGFHSKSQAASRRLLQGPSSWRGVVLGLRSEIEDA